MIKNSIMNESTYHIYNSLYLSNVQLFNYVTYYSCHRFSVTDQIYDVLFEHNRIVINNSIKEDIEK